MEIIKKLETLLKRELVHRKNVRVLGYTDQVAAYMAACDVISRTGDSAARKQL